MADVKEQRICCKFCSKLEKTASKTREVQKTAVCENAMGGTQTLELFSRLVHGETSVEDCKRSGRFSTGRTEKIV